LGTHYHDQPPEHWAGPESLDPTPIWKQGILVGVLLLVALALIVAISVPALLPQVVSPPAVVPGGRVVLSLARMPAVLGEPIRVGAPLVDETQAFYIAQPAKGEFVAVAARWSPESGFACEVAPVAATTVPMWRYAAQCPPTSAIGSTVPPQFGPRGEPMTAPRSLERYLVSVDRDRVIVNISRVIPSYGATPQPRVSPLATP
jgi:hypothetical protein